jgi:glucose-6-phosphate isomerase
VFGFTSWRIDTQMSGSIGHFRNLNTMASSSLRQRFQRYLPEYRDLDFSLDMSRMKFPEDLFEKMQLRIGQAFVAMRELEAGAIANPTERRMVGHYWLRNPALAPTQEIQAEIEDTIQRIKKFAEDGHMGKITAENGKRIKVVPRAEAAGDRYSLGQSP